MYNILIERDYFGNTVNLSEMIGGDFMYFEPIVDEEIDERDPNWCFTCTGCSGCQGCRGCKGTAQR